MYLFLWRWCHWKIIPSALRWIYIKISFYIIHLFCGFRWHLETKRAETFVNEWDTFEVLRKEMRILRRKRWRRNTNWNAVKMKHVSNTWCYALPKSKQWKIYLKMCIVGRKNHRNKIATLHKKWKEQIWFPFFHSAILSYILHVICCERKKIANNAIVII
jgi:hypothetical protein